MSLSCIFEQHWCIQYTGTQRLPTLASMPNFGVIEEIWDLNYVKFDVCVFKCKYVDSNMGVGTDDFGFTQVDLKKLAYHNEPFIMT